MLGALPQRAWRFSTDHTIGLAYCQLVDSCSPLALLRGRRRDFFLLMLVTADADVVIVMWPSRAAVLPQS